MTDKEIIIDGVDVAGCVQFIQEEEDCCNLGGSCKGWPNCYYKQLARKTQLSIKQSKELIRLRKELQESTVKNRNLKQECEELKKQLEFVRTHRTVIDAEKERYRKALEGIEQYINEEELNILPHVIIGIKAIINKAKGE